MFVTRKPAGAVGGRPVGEEELRGTDAIEDVLDREHVVLLVQGRKVAHQV